MTHKREREGQGGEKKKGRKKIKKLKKCHIK